jgi:hypothetical protein
MVRDRSQSKWYGGCGWSDSSEVYPQIQSIQKLLANAFSSSDSAKISNLQFGELLASHSLDASIDLVALSSKHVVNEVLRLDPHRVLGMYFLELFPASDDLGRHVTDFLDIVQGALQRFMRPNIRPEVTTLRSHTLAV